MGWGLEAHCGVLLEPSLGFHHPPQIIVITRLELSQVASLFVFGESYG